MFISLKDLEPKLGEQPGAGIREKEKVVYRQKQRDVKVTVWGAAF